MNITLNNILIFTAGAAIGSVVTWKVLDKKIKGEYERRLAEDTASVKEAFRDTKLQDFVNTLEEVDTTNIPERKEPTPYENLVRNLDYIVDSDEDVTAKKVIEMEEVERPEVIDPYDYGEYPDYEKETLYYYADDVLADDMDNVVEDVEDIIGSYALTTFGQYEDDAVHVRNDMKKCYYEILRSDCEYSEKYGQNLRRKED